MEIAIKVSLACAFWTGVGLLFSTQLYLLTPGSTWSAAMRSAMPRWYVWGLLAPLIVTADRLVFRRRPLPTRLIGHVLIGVVFTFVAVILRYAIESFIAAPGPAGAFFLRNAYWDVLIYGLIAGVHIARDLAAETQQRQLSTPGGTAGGAARGSPPPYAPNAAAPAFPVQRPEHDQRLHRIGAPAGATDDGQTRGTAQGFTRSCRPT
jgi:hypothetical protein